MMAALDRLRTWLACGGEEQTFLTAGTSLQLREKYPCLQEREGLTLDPLRLTLLTEDGDALNRSLEELGVYPEMHDKNHVVFILTGADGEEQLDRLDAVLTLLCVRLEESVIPLSLLPPAAETVCTP